MLTPKLMNDKLNNWSESRGGCDDIMHATDLKDAYDLDVSDIVVKRGVVLLANCQHCGRQWKGVMPWGEVAMFFLGDAVPGTRATRQGVWIGVTCNGCQKDTPVLLDWDEVRRYVDKGIRSESLDPRILKAARR